LSLTFLVFLAAAYFFAYAESSTIAAQRILIHHASTEGDPRASLVEAFRENPRRFFGTTLIGTNISIIAMSALGAHQLLHYQLGWLLPVATIVVDIVILVIAEITPKTLSLADPTQSSLKISRALDFSSRILAPLIWLITFLPSKLLNIDAIFHSEDEEIITEGQLKHMIGLSAKQGGIERSEGERAVKVFKFADTDVETVMTPRADMVVLNPGDTLREALHEANSTGFSRLPVLNADGDDSTGFINAKDILKLHRDGKLDDLIDSHVRKIRFIPETKRILDLLGEFRTTGEQIALVVNEHGTITGLVTLEDILEEVLGEIYDEYDNENPDAHWVGGGLVIAGAFPAEKLAERLNVKLPDGDYDTAAGLLLHMLGDVPKPGASVDLDGWKLIATHVVRHRITRINARRK